MLDGPLPYYRMTEGKKYQVYLLRNAAGRQYIGVSEDIVVRLGQHNAGESTWTAKYRPWRLVWCSEGMPLGEARKLENLLKRQKGGRGLQALLERNGYFL